MASRWGTAMAEELGKIHTTTEISMQSFKLALTRHSSTTLPHL